MRFFPVAVFLILFTVNLILAQDGKKVLVCYWGTWSHYRIGKGQFRLENIPSDLCTHIVYSFFKLDPITNRIIFGDEWLDLPPVEGNPRLDNIRRTIDLRNSNPSLKVTLAVGGWNEGSENYSLMARDPAKRAAFVASAISMINEFDFDGLDMDWEYPARRGGIPEDKQNFVLLLKELREAFDALSRPGRDPLLLTSAFGAYEKFLDVSYDIPEISKYLDYFHLMLYDFKMYLKDEPSGTLIGHHSPLFSKDWEDEGNQTMTDSYSVESFLERGAPAEKLVFGVGAYGKTYRLFNRSMHNFYDEAAGSGVKGEFTGEEGLAAYYEICLELLNPTSRWEIKFDDQYKVPYAYSDSKWIGYDDEVSARIKTDYAMKLGLGGMMVWSLDFDDFANYCGGWKNFPVVATLKERLAYHENRIY